MKTNGKQNAVMMDTNDANKLALLIFTVGGQGYALSVDRVVRIIEMVTIVQLANISNFVQGMINFQGQPVLVVDLRQRLGFPEKAYLAHTPIILVDMPNSSQRFGLIVDDVEQVVHVSPDEINQQITEMSINRNKSGKQTSFLSGITNFNHRMIVLLNLDVLFDFQTQIDYQDIAKELEELEEIVVEEE